MSRSVAVVIAFLVKYRLQDVNSAYAYVKKYRKIACPNLKVIKELYEK